MKASSVVLVSSLVVSVVVSTLFFGLARDVITGRTLLADTITNIYFYGHDTWALGLTFSTIMLGLLAYPFAKDLLLLVVRRRYYRRLKTRFQEFLGLRLILKGG